MPELLRENAEYLMQLKESYSGDQDPGKLRGIVSLHAEALEICHQKETDVRNTIRALSSQVSTARADLEVAQAHGSIEELVAAMEKELQTKQSNTVSMKDEQRSLQAKLADFAGKLEAVKAFNRQQASNTRDKIHRCRHELSLYAHITRATFDDISDTWVSGVVSRLEGHDVREFSAPRLAGPAVETDHVAAVDKLWDLIG